MFAIALFKIFVFSLQEQAQQSQHWNAEGQYKSAGISKVSAILLSTTLG